MKPASIAQLLAGLLLLALAAWMVPTPRSNPRPELPEIAPFTTADRVALFIPDPENFPPADSFGLVQRARAAGAEVRIFAPGDSTAEFAPTRLYQPFPWPDTPTGYHPDQWPALPPGEKQSGNDWHMLVLTPEEIAVKNAAVLAAARAMRATGTDDPQGSREAALLARARRAELYIPLFP
jgi:hypothetical protein